MSLFEANSAEARRRRITNVFMCVAACLLRLLLALVPLAAVIIYTVRKGAGAFRLEFFDPLDEWRWPSR